MGRKLKERIGYYIAQLDKFWKEVPTVVGEFGSWNDIERNDYIETMRSYTKKVTEYAAAVKLNEMQIERYEAVKKLAEENQHFLDEIEGK